MSKLKDKTCSREKRATRAQSRQQMRCLPMFCLSEVYSKTVVAGDRAVCVSGSAAEMFSTDFTLHNTRDDFNHTQRSVTLLQHTTKIKLSVSSPVLSEKM